MSDVLITYGWVRSAYASVRNLSKHNISVSVSDTSIFGSSQFSRYREKFYKYNSHYISERVFINDLKNILELDQSKLIMPVHNETEIIAKYRDEFDDSNVALVPHYEHCKIFNNKSESYDLAKKIGIPVPDRISYREPNEIAMKIKAAGFKKSVIKLLTGNSGKGVFYASDPQTAEKKVIQLIDEYNLNKKRYPQVEEYVEGNGYGSSVLYWKGDMVANFSHKRLREKIESGGTSTLREAVNNKDIQDAAKKIFDYIGWHGLAMCEFKVCEKTGKFWFIEVNPRMWGSIPLAIEAGIEFPYLAYICATKGPELAKKYNKEKNIIYGWRGRWLLGDIFLAIKKFLKFDFKNGINILFRAKSQSNDDFHLDDPISFIGQCLSYITKSIKKRSFNPSEEGMIR